MRPKQRHRILPYIFLLVSAAMPSAADSLSCRYFYERFEGIKSITADTPNTPNNKVRSILQTILLNHYNVREVTPNMTVDAFTNFLNIIDPHRVLITRQDLVSLTYPNRSFFIDLHSQLFNGVTSPVFEHLFTLSRERLDGYIKKYLGDARFRELVHKLVSRRTNSLLKSDEKPNLDGHPKDMSQINSKMIDILALELRKIAAARGGIQNSEIQSSDILALLRKMRTKILDLQENVSEKSLTHVVAKSFLNTFDRHTDLFLPVALRTRQEAMDNNRTYLGTHTVYTNSGIKISKVAPSSPAEKAGLRTNDIVAAIEPEANSGRWYATRRLTMDEYEKLLKGTPGTKFKLRIKRENTEMSVEISRINSTAASRAILPPEILGTPNGPIMRVSFSSFPNNSASFLKKEIQNKIETTGIKGIVIDLRGNGGGDLREANDMLKLFVTQAHSIYQHSRFGVVKSMSSLPDLALWTGPLVILVDHSSASAAEVLSSALQAHQRAVIVGGPQTYGKGSTQNYLSSEGSHFKYTNTLFYSIEGNPIQWNGIKADIPLPTTNIGSHFQERDYKNSLRPDTLPPQRDLIWPAIEDLDITIQTLKEKSNERLRHRPSPETVKEIHDLNTREAYRILEDWVQMEHSKTP